MGGREAQSWVKNRSGVAQQINRVQWCRGYGRETAHEGSWEGGSGREGGGQVQRPR